jgi:transcriptional regulator with XRE-family HTH domain
MTYMTSKELKEWRKDHGYSQSQLAKTLSVAVMTVSRWETGLRSIPPFLHLALRCLELEGGEQMNKGMEKKTEMVQGRQEEGCRQGPRRKAVRDHPWDLP